ncbi:UNVERIFIED_CONTAM: hypothetical protein FKN15_034660 [Acipenser sinensis]
MQAYLSDDRVAAIHNCLAMFQQGSIVLVLCRKLLGLMATASSALQLGLLHMRLIQAWLNAFRLHPKHDRHRRLIVSRVCWQASHLREDIIVLDERKKIEEHDIMQGSVIRLVWKTD